MKKKKLKRRSKNPIKKAKDEADRALQDAYRRNYSDEKCESCGSQFYCMHHFIEKSKSNNLRFNPINLIFICSRCHSLHHNFGDATIHAKIQSKKGEKWWKKLQKEYKIKKQCWTNKELESIIKKYEISKGTNSLE